MVSQARLKELFKYRDGNLIHRNSNGKSKAGAAAGYIKQPSKTNGKEYVYIGVDGGSHRAHRLIYLWHHGELPPVVDHEDNNSLNNDIENLRAATYVQNGRNKAPRKGASSKYHGVSMTGPQGRWRARIKLKTTTKHIGTFQCEKQAAMAYDRAARLFYGQFASLNFKEL